MKCDPTSLRPKTIGPISKVVPPVPANSAPADQRFAIGADGIFALNPEKSLGVDLFKQTQLDFRTEKGYQRAENQYLPFGPVDVLETPIGHFIASDAGVFYSPFMERNAFQRFMTTGNPELVNTDFEIEKYSPFCGDDIANPPTSVSSIAKSSEDDVIVASSPDGVFRLKVFDSNCYRQLARAG